MGRGYFEYRSKKYAAYKQHHHHDEKEEWERTHSNLGQVTTPSPEDVGGEPLDSVKSLLKQRKKEKEKMTEKKRENEEEEGLTIKQILEQRRKDRQVCKTEPKVRESKPNRKKKRELNNSDPQLKESTPHNIFGKARLPSLGEGAEEWEYCNVVATSPPSPPSTESDVGGLGHLFEKLKINMLRHAGEKDVEIGSPDLSTFRKITNPIEMRNKITKRLAAERRTNWGTNRVVIDVIGAPFP